MFTDSIWNRLKHEGEFIDNAMTLIASGMLTPEYVTRVFDDARRELESNIKKVERYAEAKGVTCRVQWNDFDITKMVNKTLGITLHGISRASRFCYDSSVSTYQLRSSLEQNICESLTLSKVLKTATKSHVVRVDERQFRYGIDNKYIIETYANGNMRVNAAEHMNELTLIASKASNFLSLINDIYKAKS